MFNLIVWKSCSQRYYKWYLLKERTYCVSKVTTIVRFNNVYSPNRPFLLSVLLILVGRPIFLQMVAYSFYAKTFISRFTATVHASLFHSSREVLPTRRLLVWCEQLRNYAHYFKELDFSPHAFQLNKTFKKKNLIYGHHAWWRTATRNNRRQAY